MLCLCWLNFPITWSPHLHIKRWYYFPYTTFLEQYFSNVYHMQTLISQTKYVLVYHADTTDANALMLLFASQKK